MKFSTLLFFLIGISIAGTCQIKVVKDSIRDQDTFLISNPINTELADYFDDPHKTRNSKLMLNKSLFNCMGSKTKKDYWYYDKDHTVYQIMFHCTKEKCPTFIFNENNKVECCDTLIEISTLYKEPLFGKNDFIGQNRKAIIARFGNTYIKKGDYLIYHDYKDKLLVLFFASKKVAFYRYVRLNKSVKYFKDIDKGILKTK